jgi:hypothetical protein
MRHPLPVLRATHANAVAALNADQGASNRDKPRSRFDRRHCPCANGTPETLVTRRWVACPGQL